MPVSCARARFGSTLRFILKKSYDESDPEVPWTETPAWRHFPDGWKPLYGRIADGGVSIEWHDFKTRKPFEWGESFHPNSVEVCLNLEGEATLTHGDSSSKLTPATTGVYVRGTEPMNAQRAPQQRHRFITMEFTPEFLKQHLDHDRDGLNPVLSPVFNGAGFKGGLGEVAKMTGRQKQFVTQLLHPPVMRCAQSLWYQGKVLEFMAEVFFADADEDLFCNRQKRVARDRVDKVKEIICGDLESPPTLQQLGQKVGCSHYYLSRTFSQETGMTIPQYIRQVRIEKAAELLVSGKFNVTEAALEVGYNSISHFSQAFCQLMGSCPTLYPSQQAAKRGNAMKETAE